VRLNQQQQGGRMTALRRMTGRTFGKGLSGAAAALALALATPALAQNADAPVDVTAAPPPSAETVGPSTLRDFNLQGTVTRPSDRPATTGTPAQPAPGAPAPAVTSGEPATTAPQAAAPTPRAAARSTGPDAPAAASNLTIGESVATPSTPLDVTTESAPAPGFAPPAESAAASLPGSGESLPWPWIAALLALVLGGGFIVWSRRGRRNRYGDPGRLAFAGLAPDVAPEARPLPQPRPQPRPDPIPPRAQPAPAPTPKTAPAPPPKEDDGLIVSTSLKPELNVQFQPDRAVVTENEVLVQFDVLLVNSGSAPARDVLVEGRLVAAHAGQDQEIAAFFQNPVGQGDRIATIPPLGRISLKSAVRLPISQLHSFEAAGRKLFVPLVAFNILFRSNAGEGHASASFLVGRGSEEDEKLAPFRLDLGPRIFRGLSARPHSMGLQRA
jgi:hypothetical protein